MRGQSRWVGILIGASLGACQPEEPTCILNLGIDITNIVVSSYNDVVRNNTSASSWSYACNQGGSANITGGVTNASNVSFDLTYTFTNCKHQDLGDVITLNGVLHDITQNGGGDAKTESASSDALTIQGDVIGCNADPIDATCDVNIFYSGTWLTSICGLSYP